LIMSKYSKMTLNLMMMIGLSAASYLKENEKTVDKDGYNLETIVLVICFCCCSPFLFYKGVGKSEAIGQSFVHAKRL